MGESSTAITLETGAPDEILMISRSALLGAMSAELLASFDDSRSGLPTLSEFEAISVASRGLDRALAACSSTKRGL